jgi:hypothetical protein
MRNSSSRDIITRVQGKRQGFSGTSEGNAHHIATRERHGQALHLNLVLDAEYVLSCKGL